MSAAFSPGMQTTHDPIPLLALFPGSPVPQFPEPPTKSVDPYDSSYALEEINAYAAIRDDLLAEAEETPTRAKLESVQVANDFVETCLQPPRSSYQAQHLSGAEAAWERKRCNEVKNRIAEIRARIPTGYAV